MLADPCEGTAGHPGEEVRCSVSQLPPEMLAVPCEGTAGHPGGASPVDGERWRLDLLHGIGRGRFTLLTTWTFRRCFADPCEGTAGHPGGFFEMTLFLLILEILDAWTRSQKVLHCPVAWTGVKVTTAWGHREAASEPIGVRGFLLKF